MDQIWFWTYKINVGVIQSLTKQMFICHKY